MPILKLRFQYMFILKTKTVCYLGVLATLWVKWLASMHGLSHSQNLYSLRLVVCMSSGWLSDQQSALLCSCHDRIIAAICSCHVITINGSSYLLYSIADLTEQGVIELCLARVTFMHAYIHALLIDRSCTKYTYTYISYIVEPLS